MGEIGAIRPGVSKKLMSSRTDRASLRQAHFIDVARAVETKVFCLGYFCAPRHRAEFLRVLKFIQEDLPLGECSLKCIDVCLDILRERYLA